MRIFLLSALILDCQMFCICTKYEYVVFVIYYFYFPAKRKTQVMKQWGYGLNCANWTLIRMIKTDNEWILP